MRATAIIPARGGSKGLPGKNLARVGGVPLVVRAVRSALASASVHRVVVSTDAADIAAAARGAGAEIVWRGSDLAGDTASSESALLHALSTLKLDSEIIVFIQATSPFIDPADIDAAVDRVADGECDVVFSAVASHAFLWRNTDAGAIGLNHDSSTMRQRRQDREPEFRETGAFYVMRTAGLVHTGHRFFGRVGVQLVPDDHGIDIDEAADLAIARAVAQRLEGSAPVDVDAVVTDFDGVHTDDTASVDETGRESVRVHRGDGHGVRMLREAGVPVLILSREASEVVAARARKLRVECVHGVDDKAAVLVEWADARGIRLDRIAYLGNDLADLACLELVGWPVAVADAHPQVLQAARIVLDRRGGAGAVRELAERVLAARLTDTTQGAEHVRAHR